MRFFKLLFHKYVFACLFTLLFSNKAYQANASEPIELKDSISVLKNISQKNPDSIVRFADELLLAFQSDANARLSINNTAGVLLLRYGYLQLAEKYYVDAIAISKSLKNRLKEAENTNSLGVLFGKRGDFTEAESQFLRALLLAKQSNDPETMVASYLKLSTLRIRQNEIDEAYNMCLKGDSVNKKYRTYFFDGDLAGNKAIVYAIRGDLGKALPYFEECYAIALRTKKKPEQVLALQNIGLVYKEKKDYAKALEFLNRGFVLAESSGLKDEALRLTVNFAVIYTEQNEFQLANEKLLSLLTKAKKEGLEDLVIEIYDHLIYIAKEQNDYKKAFEYLGSAKEIKDRLDNAEKEQALRESNISLGLYAANRKLEENENLLFQKNREQNILFGILVFVGILLSFLVFILFRLRRLNNKLNIKRAQLVDSNNVKDKLFSIIGHDLRGNQSTTLGILGLIKDGELKEEELETYLSMLIKQSTSALAILDDLLLWGKAQIKGDSQQQSIFEIWPVVQGVFDFNLEAIHQKKLNIKALDDERIKVNTGINHFSFVIRNLVANAIKFTPIGGKIRVYASNYTKDFVKICVADSGEGLNDAELAAIFLPGYSNKTGTNKEGGSGLGLLLCKEFVEANEGKIWAERNSDGGTTICFTCKKA